MAYYNKIGLLILNKNKNKFLVCEKSPENITSDYIMPGGKFEENSVEDCLKNEIKEELDCEVDFNTLEYIGEYKDIAAGSPDKDVSIRLYKGNIIGIPKPSTEIKFIHWIGRKDVNNLRISPIIRNKIIPDLIKRDILK
ncbi:MAG: NUDIX domain-containing protein [Candidatus Woesearchaeota archaeon]